ncbi:hypothetical protein QFZ23_004552 [Arthrobacter globiformis]|uniref:hypothetical protein n=1 Tax=Arthrobacter globiformis TaxID=1665 RepID=UPI00278669FC|nr:hypothetical protein [Arthrobacter globiformis]MDQ1060651.1 hypothetical protein [Arthrobacter globiformis]
MTVCAPNIQARSPWPAREQVANWATLSPADEVEIRRNGRTVAAGCVDMRAPDGSVIWLIQDGGRGRVLFLQGDGVTVFRRARRHIAGTGRTRIPGRAGQARRP